MLELLGLWLVLLIVCLTIVRWRRGEGTLLLAYFMGLSLIHVPGALNLIGTVARLPGEAESIVGFRATVLGLAALLAGVMALRLARLQPAPHSARRARPVRENGQLSQVGRLFLILGVTTSFILLPLSTVVGSLTSLTSVVASFLIVGYWMLLRDAMERGRRGQVFALIAALPVMPFATLLFGGFAGFGIMWMIMVSCFYISNAKNVRWVAVLAPLVVWAGLSVAVSYLEQRREIRGTVWATQSSLTDRVEKISGIVGRLRPYSFNDYRDVFEIDRRLNQNFLVGRGIMRHEAGIVPLVAGSTLSPTILIPRAIWPDKPQIGGGGDLVTRFTGLRFDESTSIGAGQVLEFYANFGWAGVVLGFALLGAVIGLCDAGLARGFQNGDVRKILTFGLPGIALMQPGGNLIEIVVAVVAAIVVARVAGTALSRRIGRAPPAGRRPAALRR